MYLSHFNFATPPFSQVTHPNGDFIMEYHQDVDALLTEKIVQPGMISLFSDDEDVIAALCQKLTRQHPEHQIINAFPRLSADSLLYKLNEGEPGGKTTLQAIDALLTRWLSQRRATETRPRLVIINRIDCARERCGRLLATLKTRAEERNLPLTLLLTGHTRENSPAVLSPDLQALMPTSLTLRPLSGRECQRYFAAQMAAQGVETSPFPRDRIRKMHTLTGGNLTKINQVAHLALLAAWTERAARVSARHLQLAAGETLPPQRSTRRVVGVAAATVLAGLAAGWLMTGSLVARLPVSLPVPASWKQMATRPPIAPPPAIEALVVSPQDAMYQLYKMWGYDASAEEAQCQNAGRVSLICKEGTASLNTLIQGGEPWISELRTGDHLNYAVVARVDDHSLDLLLNNQTWQVSRDWYQKHATQHYTLLHHLTPDGKESINAASSEKDIKWLDNTLSQVLSVPASQAHSWTATLMKHIEAFQRQSGITVDGIAGEDTLVHLMQASHAAPTVIVPANTPAPQVKGKP